MQFKTVAYSLSECPCYAGSRCLCLCCHGKLIFDIKSALWLAIDRTHTHACIQRVDILKHNAMD